MRIGLLGKMGAGKTTLANKIIKCYPEMKKMSFADPLKQIAVDLFDMKHKDRKLLQQIGTKMREIDDNVWANALLRKIGSDQNIIIDDVRYLNEIILLKNAGFKICYLDIDETDRIKYLRMIYASDSDNHIKQGYHESEQADSLKHMADMIVNCNTDPACIFGGDNNDILNGRASA